MTPEERGYVKSSLSRNINFTRFNYASLPENLTASFAAAASRLPSISAEDLKPILDSTLAPQLLHLLDVNKELLSKENLSEEERNTFLATKAQAAGLSATELEAILNSGFFYIPFVDSYDYRVERGYREIKSESGKVLRRIPLTEYTHSLRLGLLWYKLNVDRDNKGSVLFVGMARGWNTEPIVRNAVHEDETFEGKRIYDDGTEDFDAFKNAVDVSAFNIQVETKSMDAFRLSGEVTEATLFGVRLNLGDREGVRLDDTYWVEELEETTSGDIVKNKRGFVKIREVGDNKNDETAVSYAQTISGTNYSEGLSVTELPLLGVNGVIALGMFPVGISVFDNTKSADGFGLSDNNFAMRINSESKTAYGAAISFQADLANETRIPELWASIGGALGISSVDGKVYYLNSSNDDAPDSTDIGASLTGYVNAGILKKFYFRRFGLLFQADVKYSLTHISAAGDDGTSYKLTNGNLGLDGKAALEVYVTPVFSLGAGAEYNIFGTSSSWSAVATDKNNNDIKNNDATGPDVKYSGLGVYFWGNYSLPSLK